ncbi:alpha/beta hydrolase family protein [Hymenobacter mucosus]|uniref:Serine aminopeptidase S33 domain-containing protein n=1 Tax=Hymenobacter mucosus TaxID=1411120 RepID=A0A238ZY87_9BACT|nr:alpha/beta fold hydrolase [Hymenobacter mucosus]SNR88229.1 hypothetical protein SAMN06269173_11065 [Hymenobacter mucosus]
MRYALVLLVLVLLGCWLPGPARAAAPVALPGLDGYWKGPLQMPGAQMDVVFRLVSLTGGGFYATLDVPQRKLDRLPVRVQLLGDSIVLEVEDFSTRFAGRVLSGGRQLAGRWQQPGYSAPMTLELVQPMAPVTAPKTRLTPPYREEEVSYVSPTDALRFGGMLTIPAGKGPFAAVVLVADQGGYDREGTVGDYPLLAQLGDYLTRRGIAVLRFDSRGSGQTGGTLADVAQTTADVHAALGYLRTRPEINVQHIGVVGHGVGANVGLLSATQPLPPSFVVGLAAHGQPGSALLVEQQVNLLKSMGAEAAQVAAATKQQQLLVDMVLNLTNAEQARTIVANLLLQASGGTDTISARAGAAEMTTKRFRDYLRFDPLPGLARVRCPVLLLHGAADVNVAPEPNLPLLTKALRANPNLSSRKLPGVNYLFQSDPATWPLVNGQPRPTMSPEALEAIRAWIVQRTTKP